MMFQHYTHSMRLFQLMFQPHANKQIKHKKIKDKKVKNTVSLLTQFGDKHTLHKPEVVLFPLHFQGEFTKM